jgi:type IV pilus biogenesis protein PilP
MVADPLEPSRPNPFLPRSGVGPTADGGVVAASPHYGPDWSQLPIAERVGFVTPEIPSAPTPPLPRIDRAPEAEVRVTSILWDAKGQAIAAYEDAEGDTGELKPGDRVPGTGMTVQEITRSGVTLTNPRTGEEQSLGLRPRSEKKEEPRQQQPRRQQRRGGGGGGGFPAAPPG